MPGRSPSLFDDDDTDPLDQARRRGRHERAADKLIREWRVSVDGWTAVHAMNGSVIRAHARALDVAELVLSAAPAPYAAQSAAICARELRDCLRDYGHHMTGSATGGDPFQQFLDSLSADPPPPASGELADQ